MGKNIVDVVKFFFLHDGLFCCGMRLRISLDHKKDRNRLRGIHDLEQLVRIHRIRSDIRWVKMILLHFVSL